MQKISFLIVAMTITLSPHRISGASELSASSGLIGDSHLDLLLRNYYRHQTGDPGHQRDWTQGLMLNFSSGYTSGLIGVGVDAFAYGAFKLDGGSGRIGSPTVPYDSEGEPQSNYSKAGASLKVQAHKTVLQAGALQPHTPVFSTANHHQLNQTANGWMISSDELDKLNLQLGHFTSGTGLITTAHDGELELSYASIDSRSISYAGGTIQQNENLSFTFYGSKFEDVMNQYYVNTNIAYPLSSKNTWSLDFNIYRSVDAGTAKAGPISVTAASLASSLSAGPHTYTLAFQKNDGDQPQDYAGVGGRAPGVVAGKYTLGIYLASAAELSDFNAPNEKSVSLRYDLDATAYGIPGLSFIAKHIYARGIDGSRTPANSAYFGFYGDNESERETDFYLTYTVQTGKLKGLKAYLIQSFHSGAASTGGDGKQTRFFLDLPLSIF